MNVVDCVLNCAQSFGFRKLPFTIIAAFIVAMQENRASVTKIHRQSNLYRARLTFRQSVGEIPGEHLTIYKSDSSTRPRQQGVGDGEREKLGLRNFCFHNADESAVSER